MREVYFSYQRAANGGGSNTAHPPNREVCGALVEVVRQKGVTQVAMLLLTQSPAIGIAAVPSYTSRKAVNVHKQWVRFTYPFQGSIDVCSFTQ